MPWFLQVLFPERWRLEEQNTRHSVNNNWRVNKHNLLETNLVYVLCRFWHFQSPLCSSARMRRKLWFWPTGILGDVARSVSSRQFSQFHSQGFSGRFVFCCAMSFFSCVGTEVWSMACLGSEHRVTGYSCSSWLSQRDKVQPHSFNLMLLSCESIQLVIVYCCQHWNWASFLNTPGLQRGWRSGTTPRTSKQRKNGKNSYVIPLFLREWTSSLIILYTVMVFMCSMASETCNGVSCRSGSITKLLQPLDLCARQLDPELRIEGVWRSAIVIWFHILIFESNREYRVKSSCYMIHIWSTHMTGTPDSWTWTWWCWGVGRSPGRLTVSNHMKTHITALCVIWNNMKWILICCISAWPSTVKTNQHEVCMAKSWT